MAASEKVFAVKISEKDVPGAKFRNSSIAEHTVLELRRWLECRGLITSGNKDELIERCRTCIEQKEDGDIIVSIDGGKWFQQKVAAALDTSDRTQSPVPLLPTTGWKSFPSVLIPENFSYGNIYEHIISSANVYDSNGEHSNNLSDFVTEKPMKKGRQFFLSGHVKNIQDTIKGSAYFVKSIVMASYEVNKNYHVTITMDSTSGKILDASCECRASALSRCNHVAALLFAMEDFTIRFGNDPTSCTSLLCEWNVGRRTKNDHRPCHESVSKCKKRKMNRIISYEPRPTELIPNSETFLARFVSSLPNAGNTMFQTVLEVSYSDYKVDNDYLISMRNIALENLKEDVSFLKQPMEVEGTSNQSESETWHQIRRLKITASNAKTVASAQSSRRHYNILKTLLWGKSVPDVEAVQYGRKHECVAFEKYRHHILNTNCEMQISKSGFWIHPDMPELGCSPDGILRDKNNKVIGVMEIKCPYVLENEHPLTLENLSVEKVKNLCYKMLKGLQKMKCFGLI